MFGLLIYMQLHQIKMELKLGTENLNLIALNNKLFIK